MTSPAPNPREARRLFAKATTREEQRLLKRHIKGLDRTNHHDAFRLRIINQANAEAIARMLANAEASL